MTSSNPRNYLFEVSSSHVTFVSCHVSVWALIIQLMGPLRLSLFEAHTGESCLLGFRREMHWDRVVWFNGNPFEGHFFRSLWMKVRRYRCDRVRGFMSSCEEITSDHFLVARCTPM